MVINASILDELSELVNEGKLYPVSDSVFNVKYCERAFWFLQAGKVVGKPIIYFKYGLYSINLSVELPLLTSLESSLTS